MVFEVYNPKQTKSKNKSTDKTFIYLSNKLKERLEMLKKIALEDFKKAIWINVYTKYKPKVYERTESLLNAVSVSEVKQDGNSIYFDLYIDINKLEHTSVVSGHNYYDGKAIYPPALVDEGHTQEGYEETRDMFHDYPARDFMEEVYLFIKSDLQKTLTNMVKYEIKRLGGKSKY